MIAALFVDPAGHYPKIPGIDCWDAKRDARKYAGPYPVIAHPPCQLWTRFATLNFNRWGGEHNRPGNDGGCFAHALRCVREFGGVLEHPGGSRAWRASGLIRPPRIGWQRTIDGGWVCEIWQSAYGHKAAKRTWLYYVGRKPPLSADWQRLRGTHQIGAMGGDKPLLTGRQASETPIAFAEFLIELAKGAA